MGTLGDRCTDVANAEPSFVLETCVASNPENPPCECPTPHPSRAQVAGERDGQILPRAVYFGCAIGRCRFFGYVVDDENEVLTLPEGPLDADELVEMGL